MTDPRTPKVTPLLFNSEMIRALINGRKTQTRRVMKHQPAHGCRYDMVESKIGACHHNGAGVFVPYAGNVATHVQPCPWGQPGDLIWVRETFTNSPDGPIYAATAGEAGALEPGDSIRWTPSIHMPRWASRLTLRLTDVRVERVQDISEEDCGAEGITVPPPLLGIDMDGNPIESETAGMDPWDFFSELWDNINAKRGFGWEANPWVWVLGFEVIHANVDRVLAEAAA